MSPPSRATSLTRPAVKRILLDVACSIETWRVAAALMKV
jgi:hypothetical protein